MTMGTKRTTEFMQEAVRVALTSGLTRKQVAADFGIGFSTLSKWIQQDRNTVEKPSVQSDLEREIVELRRENRLLREEREVLKKATQFFANQKPFSAM
jgi:transposase